MQAIVGMRLLWVGYNNWRCHVLLIQSHSDLRGNLDSACRLMKKAQSAKGVLSHGEKGRSELTALFDFTFSVSPCL
jgi:hypothetical protein